MRKFRKIVSILLLLLFVAACVKDGYDPEGCPQERIIIIRFDWSMVELPDPEEEIEVQIIDEVEEREVLDMFIHREGTEVELMPRMYDFVGEEFILEDVVLEKCTATVVQNSFGEYLEPTYFVGGCRDQEINDYEEVQIVVIPMRSQTRILIVRVILEGEGLNFLDYAQGVITGVTVSRELNYGFPPVVNDNIHPAFITSTVNYYLSTEDRTVYSDQHNLLGIDSNSSQYLHFTAYYTDGTTHPLDVDVTSAMNGFHSVNVHEPWVLELRINLGVGNIGATIEDWYAGAESNLIAQ